MGYLAIESSVINKSHARGDCVNVRMYIALALLNFVSRAKLYLLDVFKMFSVSCKKR